MKKIVLAPDSFKGTMSSKEICGIMTEQIRRFYPDCEILSFPIADGGEGSVDCFLTAMGGERVAVTVSGPFFTPCESFYGLVDGGKTAVVEMAAAAGLPMVASRPDPERTTTFGVGELILDAVSRGAKKIIVGLGGSCTNDAGCGAAAALGCRFYDQDGESFVPVGGTLSRVARIDPAGLRERLAGIEAVAMCDIDNPFYGPSGAAHVFAPQKGADEAAVRRLDAGLRALSAVMERDLGISIAGLPGAGAAGGFGGGMAAFFGAGLVMGIEAVLDTVGFEAAAEGSDLILTGEGRIDGQSLRGKAVAGVARRAKRLGIPVVAVVGDVGDGIEEAYDLGVSAVLSINRVARPYEEVRGRAPRDLAAAIETLMRLGCIFCAKK